MVALGRIVLAKRERVVMLEPHEKGILATTLRYPYEVRNTRTILPTSRTSRSRLTCSSSRSTSSTARPPTLSQHHLKIAMRLRWLIS